MAAQCVGDVGDLGVVEVGGDLEGDRHVAPVLVGELSLARLELAEEGVELGFALQLAQVFGVGRGDVDGDVARQRVGLVEADQVVVGGALDGGIGVLADVDAEDAAVLGLLDVADQGVDAVVVETHPVDDALDLGQPEHARLGVARLRARGDRADFDEAAAHAGEAVDGFAVLVEAGGEADAVGELQPHHLDRRGGDRFGGGQHPAGEVQAGEGGFVGGLRIEGEQHRAGDFVEHSPFYRSAAKSCFCD